MMRNSNLLVIVEAGLRLRSRAAWGRAAWGRAAWGRAAWGRAAWGRAAWGRAAWGDEDSRHRLSIGPGIRRIASPPSGMGSTRVVRYGDDAIAIIAGDESGDSLSLPRSTPCNSKPGHRWPAAPGFAWSKLGQHAGRIGIGS